MPCASGFCVWKVLGDEPLQRSTARHGVSRRARQAHQTAGIMTIGSQDKRRGILPAQDNKTLSDFRLSAAEQVWGCLTRTGQVVIVRRSMAARVSPAHGMASTMLASTCKLRSQP